MAQVLEIAGFAAVVVGLWLLAPWLAFTVAGVGLVLAGFAVDKARAG